MFSLLWIFLIHHPKPQTIVAKRYSKIFSMILQFYQWEMNQISEDKNFLQDIHNIITFFNPCDRQYPRNSYFSLKCDRSFVLIWDSHAVKNIWSNDNQINFSKSIDHKNEFQSRRFLKRVFTQIHAFFLSDS